MVVVWDEEAEIALENAYLYVLFTSLQNAEMLRDDIINITIDLGKYPEKFPLDKFKKNNNGSWRAFEKHHYRISYEVRDLDIRIVRIRHTSQSPKDY